MNQTRYDFDVAVLGAGPGGVAAATALALRGQRVALVSAQWLMGYGLEGAYKSKTMYELAREFHKVRTRWSGAIKGATVDLSNLCSANEQGAENLRQVQRAHLAEMGIRLYEGYGHFVDPHTVEVGQHRFTAAKAIISTGTRPRMLPGIEADGVHVMTSDEVVNVRRHIGSMVVLGAGVIGCEFASIFAAVGSEVILLDSQPRILNHEDPDMASFLARALRDLGVEVVSSARSEKIEIIDGKVHTTLTGGRLLVTDAALLAIGRIPNTNALNLEAAGVTLDKHGYIPVNDDMQSNVPHIYAVGDVGWRNCPNDLALVHVAEAEGRAAAAHILGNDHRFSDLNVPFIIFTIPMIAGAGLNEREAREKYGDGVRVGKYAHVRNSRAHAMQSTNGFVKLVVAPEGDDRILGARGVGEGVDVIAGEVSVMIENNLPYHYLLRTIHAHPSLSESLQGAAMIIAGEKPAYRDGEELAFSSATGAWQVVSPT
jgi:dihydrolipoamide dehydrogenase